MGELSAKCVKWLMFGFNLIFWISGLALIIAGAVAQSRFKEYIDFLQATVTAPVLLIVVGVFICVVAFLGCCGAARDNYNMLMGFAVIVSIIFIIQFAGGIAGYVQKGKIASSLNKHFPESMALYETNNGTKKVVDEIQTNWQCCGAKSFKDWFNFTQPATTVEPVTTTVSPTTTTATTTTTKANNETHKAKRDVAGVAPDPKSFTVTQVGVVESCCKDGAKNCNPADLSEGTVMADCVPNSSTKSKCKINTVGCETHIQDVMEAAIGGVAGAAIGLAFIQLFGIIFACYLARRIRSGYVYA